jgi:hypothetical protein
MEIENIAFYLAFSGSVSFVGIILGHAVAEMKRILGFSTESSKKE